MFFYKALSIQFQAHFYGSPTNSEFIDGLDRQDSFLIFLNVKEEQIVPCRFMWTRGMQNVTYRVFQKMRFQRNKAVQWIEIGIRWQPSSVEKRGKAEY